MLLASALLAYAVFADGKCGYNCGNPPSCSACTGFSDSSYCKSSQSNCEQGCGGKWCGGGPGPTPPTPPSPSGSTAKTTRYWDCCKPSCAWSGNCNGCTAPARACYKDGSVGGPDNKNICGGGGADGPPVYACPNTQPFASGGMLYGFAAGGGNIISSGGCCACYQLDFTTSTVAGKSMIVQVTNTGGDLGENHFDLQMPGGGFGIFDGCSGNPPNGPAQYNVPDSAWGQRYGGVTNRAACAGLPTELQAGCRWRFDDFMGADNPYANFRQVACPSSLTSKSGCGRSNEAEELKTRQFSSTTRLYTGYSTPLKEEA